MHPLFVEERGRYFLQVLPAFIDAYFRGDGSEFLWRLLDAHDRRSLAAIDTVVPGKRALKQAANALKQCPPILHEHIGGNVLGLFTQQDLIQPLALGGQQHAGSDRRVEIFGGALLEAGFVTDEALRTEIFWTLFHEYIHYFESFLLKREQPLAGRERGIDVDLGTLVQAQQRDRRAVRWKWIKGTLGALVVLGCLGMAALPAIEHALAPPPAPEPVGDLAAEKRSEEERLARDAQNEQRLLEAIAVVQSVQVDPRDVELVAPAPIYDSTHPRPREVLVLSRLIPDPKVPGSVLASEKATAQIWWMRPGLTFPPRLVGLAWEPDAGIVQLHASVR